jgi:hypothetical protein
MAAQFSSYHCVLAFGATRERVKEGEERKGKKKRLNGGCTPNQGSAGNGALFSETLHTRPGEAAPWEFTPQLQKIPLSGCGPLFPQPADGVDAAQTCAASRRVACEWLPLQ